MPRARDGFESRTLELPVGLWERLEALGAGRVSPIVLAEDAIARYCDKPPKALPEPRKRGPKPRPPADGAEAAPPKKRGRPKKGGQK